MGQKEKFTEKEQLEILKDISEQMKAGNPMILLTRERTINYGSLSSICTLITALLRHLYEDKIIDDKLMDRIIYLAKINEEGLAEEFKKVATEFLEKFTNKEN